MGRMPKVGVTVGQPIGHCTKVIFFSAVFFISLYLTVTETT